MESFDWLVVCALLVIFWPLWKRAGRNKNSQVWIVKNNRGKDEHGSDLFRASWDCTHPFHSSNDD